MENKRYLVLVSIYKNIFKDKKDIFPYEWYNIKEYELKNKILKDCIDNNLLIINSRLYYDFRLLSLKENL